MPGAPAFARQPTRNGYSLNVLRKIARSLIPAALLIPLVVIGYALTLFYRSLPADDGRFELPGLAAPVAVSLDRFGIPAIEAGSRLDAYRGMGFMTARDRLFQMDLMRRLNSGTLAEVIGESAVSSDIAHRILGFAGVAAAVAARLPAEQREVLQAYVEGVNGFLSRHQVLPFEFQVLSYRPAPWRIEDCILIVLGMFESLDLNESEERMLSVMERALPADVVAFLTRRRDPYEPRDTSQRGAAGRASPVPIPVESLSGLRHAAAPPSGTPGPVVGVRVARAGSNAWAVAGSRTSDGAAILANDMHLPLSVPNIWYRLEMRGGDAGFAGIVLPGTPLLVAGSNGHLAWGLTHFSADVLDLVQIEVDPQQAGRYKTADGWRDFDTRLEQIRVSGARDVRLTVRNTLWGPVATAPLLGRMVAIRWTALDAETVDLGLSALDRARSISDGVTIVNRTAGPPLNVVLADEAGHIAWTVMGRLPIRAGFDGVTSRSWSDGSVRWQGYVAPERLPRIIDPASGTVVSANDRAYGEDYPYPIAHSFDNGYRAFRIRQRLTAMDRVTEAQVFALQLDTETAPYRYYRDLALNLLSGDRLRARPELQELRDYLADWDGRAETGSSGIALLVEFRARLADAVLSPFLASCRDLDPEFAFSWPQIDVPLQDLLSAQPAALNPDPDHYPDWERFLLAQLERSAESLRRRFDLNSLAELRWGSVNAAPLKHPFSETVPLLDRLLDMSAAEMAGCELCVRFATDDAGATERLVVSPSRPAAGILHMPGGQSGHPLSSHYRDQHPFWSEGLRLPLLSGDKRHTLQLRPAR